MEMAAAFEEKPLAVWARDTLLKAAVIRMCEGEGE